MKVYMFTDLEGVSGVTEFEYREDTSFWNARKRHFYSKLLTEEINAASRGCFNFGATYVLVNDCHGSGYTMDPELVDPRVELLHGGPQRPTWLPLMEENFDALVMVGTHSKAGTRGGVLYHTMGTGVKDITINNVSLGEIGLATFIAGAYDVPAVFLSGDEAACNEIKELVPGIVTVAVKRGLSRYSAVSIPPIKARKLIEKGVIEALKKIGEIKPFKMTPPYTYREYVFNATREETRKSNPEEIPKEYELKNEIRADTAQDLIKKVFNEEV